MIRMARRRPTLRSPRLASSRFHWSLEVRVIEPAQRLDDWAVRVRLRAVRWVGPRPSRHRSARSVLASRPRWSPTARKTPWSSAVGRSRVRILAPAGRATTNDSLIERMSGCYSGHDTSGDVHPQAPYLVRTGGAFLTAPGRSTTRPSRSSAAEVPPAEVPAAEVPAAEVAAAAPVAAAEIAAAAPVAAAEIAAAVPAAVGAAAVDVDRIATPAAAEEAAQQQAGEQPAHREPAEVAAGAGAVVAGCVPVGGHLA